MEPEGSLLYAIKAAAVDAAADVWTFGAQKTMYGGKRVRPGDHIAVFDSENEGGLGLVARGVVVNVEACPKRPGIERQTPRVTLTIESKGRAIRRLGRAELKALSLSGRGDSPEAELHFKLYRQATNKIVGLSVPAAVFLHTYF